MAADRRRTTSTGRALAAIAAPVAIGMLLLAACSDGDGRADSEVTSTTDGTTLTTTTAEPTAPVTLEFRPVLATTVESGSRPTGPVAGATAPEVGAPCPADPAPPAPDASGELFGCTEGVIDGTYLVGPVAVDGSGVASATAVRVPTTGEWVVNPVMKAGASGIGAFNAAAAECFARDETCPTGQLAVVVDGVVLMAPTIQTSSFEADQIQMSGNLTEASATALAAGITAGR